MAIKCENCGEGLSRYLFITDTPEDESEAEVICEYCGEGTGYTVAEAEDTEAVPEPIDREEVYPGGEDNEALQRHREAPKDGNGDPLFGEEHFVNIRSVQIYTGGFDATFLENGELKASARQLQFEDEKSLSFSCTCGRSFLKFETATEHLKDQQ